MEYKARCGHGSRSLRARIDVKGQLSSRVPRKGNASLPLESGPRSRLVALGESASVIPNKASLRNKASMFKKVREYVLVENSSSSDITNISDLHH